MRREVRWLSAVVIAAHLWGCKQQQQPPAPAAPVTSERPAGAEFEVKASVAEPVTAGGTSELVTQIVARENFHINADYPANFRPGNSSGGIRFEQKRYELGGAERVPCGAGSEHACQLRARIPFSAAKAGTERVGGVLAFSVCNPEKCLIEKVPVDVAVDVR